MAIPSRRWIGYAFLAAGLCLLFDTLTFLRTNWSPLKIPMYAENELAIGYLLTVVGVLLLLAPALNRVLNRYAPNIAMPTGGLPEQQSITAHSQGSLPFSRKSVFARKAASWLMTALGVLIGLLAFSVSGQQWIPDRATHPFWYKSFIQIAGGWLLGFTFIAGSLVALRNRRRGGLVFLICAPLVAFCAGYPDAGYLAWDKSGNGIFYSPFLWIAIGLTLLFFAPFAVPIFAIRNKKRAICLFLISAALVSPIFVRSQWTASLLPRLAGWAAPLVAFGLFWLGTNKWGWPPLAALRSTSRRRRLWTVFATCAVVVILDITATLAMTAWQSSLWTPDCSGRALFSKPVFPGHAVFTAHLIYAGHQTTDHLGRQAGDWAIGVVQDRFWGLPRWNSHVVLLTHAIFWEGETYFIDGSRPEGLLTRFLPIVEAGPCARSRPIVDAAVDLRVLHEPLPASGARIIGYVRKPESRIPGLTSPTPHTPLVGAKITATSSSGKTVAVTDQEGIYEIDNLPTDDYMLTVDLPEPQTAPVRKLHKEDFAHGKLIEQDFQVSWDGSIEGTIRDTAGNPALTWLLLLIRMEQTQFLRLSAFNALTRVDTFVSLRYLVAVTSYGLIHGDPRKALNIRRFTILPQRLSAMPRSLNSATVNTSVTWILLFQNSRSGRCKFE
ncbi:MAG TPA: carboxypeptidase-like regulatory domain-containing protein [Verrucomicrobiae bacterium]|nr:carboxypeptidase-like regulatory domain-containing protein [Verrucomicrobiae bacterium]